MERGDFTLMSFPVFIQCNAVALVCLLSCAEKPNQGRRHVCADEQVLQLFLGLVVGLMQEADVTGETSLLQAKQHPCMQK
jgi:hypothetical protein